MRRSRFLLLLGTLALLAGICWSEDLTITTYYPSPNGSFNELEAEIARFGRASIGRNYRKNKVSIPDDSLVVEGQLAVGTNALDTDAKFHILGTTSWKGAPAKKYTDFVLEAMKPKIILKDREVPPTKTWKIGADSLASPYTPFLAVTAPNNDQRIRIEDKGPIIITSPTGGASTATLQIIDGNEGEGKVLTSDITGVAIWKEGGVKFLTVSRNDFPGNPFLNLDPSDWSNSGLSITRDWPEEEDVLVYFSGEIWAAAPPPGIPGPLDIIRILFVPVGGDVCIAVDSNVYSDSGRGFHLTFAACWPDPPKFNVSTIAVVHVTKGKHTINMYWKPIVVSGILLTKGTLVAIANK
jgi:hypothetical protein